MAKALDQIVRLIDRRTSGLPTQGVVVRIDIDIVDITLGPGSGVIRNVAVQGSAASLVEGQTVAIQWVQRQGGYLAPMIIVGASTTAAPGDSEGSSGTTDHGQLSGLENDDHPQYVMKDQASIITAQHLIDPGIAQAPFLLGTNAQGQLVTGLNADKLDGLHSGNFSQLGHTHSGSESDYLDLKPQSSPPAYHGFTGYQRVFSDANGLLWNKHVLDGPIYVTTPVSGAISLSASAAGGSANVTFGTNGTIGYVAWLPDTTTNSVYWATSYPYGWNGRSIRGRVYWISSTANSGNVRFKLSLGKMKQFDPLGAEHYYQYKNAPAAGAVNEVTFDEYTLGPISALMKEPFSVRLSRVGGDPLDTHSGVVGFALLELEPII